MSCKHLLKHLCDCPQEPKPAQVVENPTTQVAPRALTPTEMGLDELELATEVLRMLDSLAAKKDFAEYCRQAWHVVEPSTKLEWNWHHELICKVMQGMFEDWEKAQDDSKFTQRVRNALFNVPPGSLKSRIIAVFFPTWVWLRRPGWKVICLSVNEAASLRDGRASRDLIRSDWYRTSFQPSWRLKDDQDAISNYGNTAGGERLSRASGSEVVGLRGDCLDGSSLVATSQGDVTIQALHEASERGETLPHVWSMNHETETLQCRRIVATRKIVDRKVVNVHAGELTLTCTLDHKIYSDGEYIAASQISGRPVFGLQQAFVEDYGVSVDVYDIQIEGNHNFFANGILVHNCILIDDANNPLEAESKLERDKVNALWTTNIHNRVNDALRSMRIGVQQRVHAADWSGYVLDRDGEWSLAKSEGWLHVVLPAEFEATRQCVTPWGRDPRTIEGESIHETRMPVKWLAEERQRLGDKYAGIMQQRPALREGGRVKRAYWGFCRLDGGIRPEFDNVRLGRPRPAGCDEKLDAFTIGAAHYKPGFWDFDWIAISVDCAAKKTERGSNYGMIVIAGSGGRRCVLDDRTRRGDILEILETLRDMVRLWRPDTILIEDKAAGDDLKTMLKREMAEGDLPMVTLEMVPTGSQGKEERLDACLPTLKNGMVALLDGATWLEDFVDELAIFPQGVNDDRVDALSMALNFYAKNEDTWHLPDASAWASAFKNN